MKTTPILLALALLALAAGCDKNPPSTPEFGSSVRMAVNNQILNKGPAGDAPVTGLDGRKAAQSMEKYRKGGEQKQSGGVLEQIAGSMSPEPAK